MEFCHENFKIRTQLARGNLFIGKPIYVPLSSYNQDWAQESTRNIPLIEITKSSKREFLEGETCDINVGFQAMAWTSFKAPKHSKIVPKT